MATEKKPPAKKVSPFGTSNRDAAFNPKKAEFSVSSVEEASTFRTQGGRPGGSINKGKGLSGGKKFQPKLGGKNGAAPARKYPNSGTNRDPGNRSGVKKPTVKKPVTPPPAPKPSGYVVRKGDNLWNIVKARLPKGSSDSAIMNYTQKTYNANKGVIGKNPNLIKPGQILWPKP